MQVSFSCLQVFLVTALWSNTTIGEALYALGICKQNALHEHQFLHDLEKVM